MSNYKFRRVRATFEYTEVVYAESDKQAKEAVLDNLLDDVCVFEDGMELSVEVISEAEAKKTSGHDADWFKCVKEDEEEREEKRREEEALASKVKVMVGNKINELKKTGR